MRRLPNSRLMYDSNGSIHPSTSTWLNGLYIRRLSVFHSGSGKEDKMEFNIIQFGERVQDARKKCGFTQESLAERVGMSRENIGRIERGLRTCSFEYLVSLAEILNVSTDYLLTGKLTTRDEIQATLQKLVQALPQL